MARSFETHIDPPHRTPRDMNQYATAPSKATTGTALQMRRDRRLVADDGGGDELTCAGYSSVVAAIGGGNRGGLLGCRLDTGAHLCGDIGQQTRTGFLHLRGRGGDSLGADGSEKAVAAPGNRLKVERVVDVVAESGSDLPYALVHALFKIDEGFAAPDLILDLISRYHLPRSTGQQSQQFEGLRREFQGVPIFADFFQVEVQLENSKAKKSVGIVQGTVPTLASNGVHYIAVNALMLRMSNFVWSE